MMNRRSALLLMSASAIALSRAWAEPARAEGAGGTTLVDGRTRMASMLSVAPGGMAYDIVPLLSAGDQIPLLTGTWPDLTPSDDLTYGIAGAPDGMGLMPVADGYWLWLQHELVGDRSDDDFDETTFSSTISGMVPGARLSLIKLTRDWQVVGGTQLVREYRATTRLMNDDGTTPRVAPGSKITIDTTARTYMQEGHVPTDFCGGMLAETGFVNPATGAEAPVWFADEENGDYSGIAWACLPDGVAYPIEGLGVFEKETTISLRDHRPLTGGVTLLLSSQDDDDGHLYLWVGTPADGDPNGFVTGQLYVMKVDGAARESGPGSRDGADPAAAPVPADAASIIGAIGASSPCRWVAVPAEVTATGEALADFVDARDADGVRTATAFLSMEDINESATHPGQIFIAANGGAGSNNYDDEGPRFENPLSRLYRVDLGIVDAANPAGWSTTITFLAEGGAGRGVSYDNLAPASDGTVLLSEDWDQGSDEADAVWEVLKAEKRAPGLYLYDEATQKTRIAFVTNQAQFDPDLDWARLEALMAAGDESEARDDQDFWETSGMIEVLEPGSGGAAAWLITVQAHSLKTDGYGEGGQVLLALPRS